MARFRILGIPVQIDPWFLLGLFFVYSWAGQGDQQVGLFAAVAIGILTLIHELGHGDRPARSGARRRCAQPVRRLGVAPGGLPCGAGNR
ncbi:MAG: hypothetical protein R2705_05890 [Ilumatobacteraceae bacterium]